MQKRVVLNSPRLKEIRRKKHKSAKRKNLIVLVIVLLLICSFAFSSRINKVNINQITISGNKIIETKEIETIIQKEIAGNYFWLFPKTNFLIYPKNKIIKELNSKLKRLKNVSININNFRLLEGS